MGLGELRGRHQYHLRGFLFLRDGTQLPQRAPLSEARPTEHVKSKADNASVSWPDRLRLITNQAAGSAGGT
jgi:hypothetical protein